MPDLINVEIRGTLEFAAAMQRGQRVLQSARVAQAMQTATLLVMSSARLNVPVDTGRLRSSIIPVIEFAGKAVRGIIGTNVVYGPFVEQPGPVRASGRRPWLEPALVENQARIEAFLAVAIVEALKG